MSITVRQWTNEDLKQIGKDRWLTTIFMNGSTFSENAIKRYPYSKRKEYVAEFYFGKSALETVTFYATDDEMAIKFLKAEYKIENLWHLSEVIRTIEYRWIAPVSQ